MTNFMFFRSLCCLFILLFFSSLTQARQCLLTVQITEYPPLAIKQNNGDWKGLNFAYLDALFRQAKCRYQVIQTPHARGIKLLKAGKVDMMLNLSRTAEREPYFHYIGPQRTEIIKLVTDKKFSPIISSWQQFDELDARLIWQIGAYFGDNIVEKLASNQELNHNLVYIADNEIMVDLVNSQRADGYFVQDDHFRYMKKNNPAYKNIAAHPIIINDNPVYIALSRKSVKEEVFNKLQQAYLDLSISGAWKNIETKYFKEHQLNNH